MAHALVSPNAAAYTSGWDISQTLESARGQVEERFLEGGTVLLSVMDVLNRLLSSLENVTTALDNKEASDTGADLRATVASLTALPITEEGRQQALVSLAHTGRELRKHVADMAIPSAAALRTPSPLARPMRSPD